MLTRIFILLILIYQSQIIVASEEITPKVALWDKVKNNFFPACSNTEKIFRIVSRINKIHRYFNPTDDDLQRKDAAVKRIKIMMIEEKINKCLVENADSEKDKDGMPLSCKQVMREFAEAAGFLRLCKIQNAFRER